FEAGDLAGVLGGLALGVVEIGRDRNNRLLDLQPEIGFRRLLHLLQYEGSNLRGRIGVAIDLYPGVAVRGLDDLVGNERLVLFDHRVVVAPTDQALDRENGVYRIGDRLELGRPADEPLAIFREGDERGRRAHARTILDNFQSRAFRHGNSG